MQSGRLICGVDEVGRGCIAGDVVAAAVILPASYEFSSPLRDSKKLSAKIRDRLYDEIQNVAVAWSISSASVIEIDEINILNASLLAMKRSVEDLEVQPDHVLVDGNKLPEWDYSGEAVIGGDDTVAEISAASILAKVYRDRQLGDLAKKYPEYGLDKHKGYPTAQHKKALEDHGITSIHRKSYAPVARLLKDK